MAPAIPKNLELELHQVIQCIFQSQKNELDDAWDVRHLFHLISDSTQRAANSFVAKWNSTQCNLSSLFPPELLARVFFHLGPPDRVAALKVCRSWRSACEGEPSLWNTFVVVQEDEHAIDWQLSFAKRMLQLSAAVPLSIDWKQPGNYSVGYDLEIPRPPLDDPLVHLMLQHAPRITSLNVYGVVLPPEFSATLTNVASLSATELILDGSLCSPHLRTLNAWERYSILSSCQPMSTLLHFHGRDDSGTADAHLFRVMPNLETLDFTVQSTTAMPRSTPPATLSSAIIRARFLPHDWQNTLTLSAEAFERWTNINLPRLKTLEFIRICSPDTALEIFQRLYPEGPWYLRCKEHDGLSFCATDGSRQVETRLHKWEWSEQTLLAQSLPTASRFVVPITSLHKLLSTPPESLPKRVDWDTLEIVIGPDVQGVRSFEQTFVDANPQATQAFSAPNLQHVILTREVRPGSRNVEGDSEIQRLWSEDIELGVWMSTGAVDSINTVVNIHGRKLDNITIKGIPTEIWREILSWDDQTLKDRFEGLAKDVLVMDL